MLDEPLEAPAAPQAVGGGVREPRQTGDERADDARITGSAQDTVNGEVVAGSAITVDIM